MQKDQLLKVVNILDANVPLHKALEIRLKVGVGFGAAWYSSQKEHWIRWLTDYETSGPYGRQTQTKRNARYVYNHIMCPPMLFWLAEASGVSENRLVSAFEAVIAAEPKPAKRCAAFRNCVAWGDIEKLILKDAGSV